MAPSPIPRVEDFIAFDLHNLSEQELNGRCIYYLAKEGRTCKIAISEPDKVRRLRRKIEHSTEIVIDDLQEYAKATCCKRFHRSKLEDCGILPALARKWQTEIRDGRENHIIQLNSLAESEMDNLSSDPIAPPMQPTTNTDRQTRYNLRSRTNTQQSLQSTRAEAPEDSANSPFRPHIQTPGDNINKKLMKILTSREGKQGTLYLYSRASSPGFVKIGLTTASTQARFSSIARQCGYVPQLLHSFSDVPHVYRVELLVHFELLEHWRVERRCAGCNIQHREWFEIDANRALQIAEQWVTWMKETKPYDRDGMLTTTWRDRLRQLQAESRPVTAESLLNMHRTSRNSPASSRNIPNDIRAARFVTGNNAIDLTLINSVLQALFTVAEQLQIQRAVELSRESLQRTTSVRAQLPTEPLTSGQLLRRDTSMSVVSQA